MLYNTEDKEYVLKISKIVLKISNINFVISVTLIDSYF